MKSRLVRCPLVCGAGHSCRDRWHRRRRRPPAPRSRHRVRLSPATGRRRMHEDALERGAGPELADYGGFPINEAAPSVRALVQRLARDAAAPSVRRLCRSVLRSASIGNARAWEERDPHTQRLIAIHWYNQTFEGHRTIWMDGRPHPPAYAPHTWMGFSTGRFVGNALEVQTTHLKQGWLRRNGLPRKRSGDAGRILRPSRRSSDAHSGHQRSGLPGGTGRPDDRLLPSAGRSSELALCVRRRRADSRSRAGRRAELPVRRAPLREGIRRQYKIPLAAYLGGPETMYPEFAAGWRALTDADGVAQAASGRARRPRRAALSTRSRATASPRLADSRQRLSARRRRRQHRRAGRRRRPVRGRQRQRPLADKTVAAIRRLSDKPIQFIANTSFQPEHTGGNADCERRAPTRACAGHSSRCNSPTPASAPRSWRIRTCRTA